MPKPKAAKAKADTVEASEAREVLQLLDCNAAPPAETLHKIFRLSLGPCGATCGKGNKGTPLNPCCFHGLLPAENCFRKKGLWQKEPVLGQLGHDPADDKQLVAGAPAGLRNLGNTCYVNAAMQFLHSLPAFRNALYMLEPELAEQDIVRQMRDLFIEMHFGPKRYVDPEPFANSLLLDHAIQQDGQEFLKLLLSKLELVFAASQQREVTTVIPDLFQGHLSHVTTCHTCNQPSEGSKREVEFYELSLQVQNMPSLHHSMVAALAPDELVGDNQYFCDYCAAKSDADRRMHLRSLPPYLCLALQRFTYDQQTWEKKKVLHKLSIPLRLDLGQVLSDAGLPLPEAAPLGPDKQPVLPGSPNSNYELAAVLIHKGTSASHGHYVAHIKLHDTGTWWRFDDEEAVEMGQQPTSHPADHGTTAAAAAAGAAGSSAASGSAATDEDGKPAVGKKRGRGGAAAGGGGGAAKRGRGGGGRGRRAGAGGGGKKGRKKQPWDDDSDADAEAEAATAAAEAADADDLAMQQAMQLSLAEANNVAYGGVEDVGIAADAMAEEVAGAGSRTSSRRAAEASKQGGGRGRGRGRGRGKGKAAEAAEEPAEAAGPNEQEAALPPALVEQILSANAYFLVYRHCPPGSTGAAVQQPAANACTGPADAQPSGVQQAATAAAAASCVAGDGQNHPDNHQHTAGAGHQQPQQQMPSSLPSCPAASAVVGQQDGQQQQQPSEQQLPAAALQLQAQLSGLPAAVRQQVAQLHKEFEDTCSSFQQKKEAALAAVTARQQEVSSIADLLPVPDGAEGCFMCLTWLEGWVNNEGSPDPIDNSPLLCEHHALSPLLASGTYKYVSDTAWQELTARHRGGPRLACGDVCVPCLKRLLQGLVSNEDLAGLREQLLAALEEDEANQDVLDAGGYYVSKSWVTGFKRRSVGGGVTGRLDAPTAGITCPHGSMVPEGRSGTAKRFAVSAGTWAMLRRLWAQQVLADVQARRDKAARAAKRAAAAGTDAVAVADKDDDCVIMDSPQRDKEQQQQEQQEQAATPKGDGNGDDVCLIDDEPEQQREVTADSPDAAEPADGAAAAAGAPASSWQLPVALDGSVALTEHLLLQHLPEFNVANSYDCDVCAASLQEAAAGHQEVKQQLEVQKQVLGKLLAGSVNEALEAGVTYYLVPNAWLDTWRKHVQAALSKKLILPSQLPPAPEPLPKAVRALLCCCHPDCPLLAVPPPNIVNKRGRFSQGDAQKDALRVVTEDEWQQLLLHHSGLESQLDGDAAAATGAPAAAAARGPAAQQDTAAGSRGRRRAPKNAERQEPLALHQQEQQQVFVQCIASMADTDVGFRGIKTWLKVAPVEMQQQQHGAPQQQQPSGKGQPPDTRGAQMDQDGQVLLVQGVGPTHQHPGGQAAQQLHQQQMHLPGEQQPLANGASHASEEQQQQLPAASGQVITSNGDVGNGPAVDLTASPGRSHRRSTRRQLGVVVDLSSSPKVKAAAAADADTDVVMVDSIDLANGCAASGAAAAAAAAEASSSGEDMAVEEVEPDGSTAQRRAGQQQQQQRPSLRRKGAAASTVAALGASSGVAGASDNDEAGEPSAPAVTLRGWLETEPGPCEATLQAEAAARRAATLVYDGVELMVELVTEEELQTAFITAGTGERRSRRARKNRQPVKASSTDTLSMLRLKVFEALSVHPRNQRLFVRGQLLEGDQDTLAKLEVFPDEEIRLVNANQVPDDDYASVFDGVAGTGKRKAREVETGFKDTALLGAPIGAVHTPAAAVQEDADPAVPSDKCQAPLEEEEGA